MVNLFKNEKDENRNRYKTWILSLILLVFIVGSFSRILEYHLVIFKEEPYFVSNTMFGYYSFKIDEELYFIFDTIVGITTLSYKLGLIYITIWYGIKSGMKKVWAWILGFSTLLPLMWIISIVYLLKRKSSKEDDLNILPNREYYEKQREDERAMTARIDSLPEPSLGDQILEQQLEQHMSNNRLAIQIYGKPFEQLTSDQKEKLIKKKDNDAWIDKIFLKIDDDAWINEGIALDSLGKHEEAPACYDKALEINPKDDNIWFNKACSQILIKNNNNRKIFCKNCGAELKEDSFYCSSCGFFRHKTGLNEGKKGIIGQFLEILKLSFNWSGRFSRRQFIILYIGINSIFVSLVLLIELTGSIGSIQLGSTEEVVAWALAFFFLIYNSIAAIRRFHDMNKSEWYVLLMFIPLVNVLVLAELLFTQGKEIGKTRWG